jgi:quercetin dioxygenase-like cupin family protein
MSKQVTENVGKNGNLEKPTAVRDRASANQFDWGAIQWLISGDLMDGANITFGFVEIEPGCKNPRHYHPNSDEVLYLIEGELNHSLGDSTFHLTAGMAIFIPQLTPHDAFNAGTKTARMVVAYPTGDRQMVALEAGRDE